MICIVVLRNLILCLFQQKMHRQFCRYFYLLFFLFVYHTAFCQNILINEVMSSNRSAVTDYDGDYSDWIELYNNSDDTTNLSLYYLSDDFEELQKYRLPNILLKPFSFYCIFASGKDTVVNNQVHANFKLSADGESVFLFSEDGVELSMLEIPELNPDISYGRLCDTSNTYVRFFKPTVGGSNCNSVIWHDSVSILILPERSKSPNPVSVEIKCTYPEAVAYYTLDNSLPDENSLLYEEPIVFSDKTSSPNIYCNHPVYLNQSVVVGYTVPKCNTVRAACFVNGTQVGDVLSKSYFVGKTFSSQCSLPVLSLITDAENLFSNEKGLFVSGLLSDSNQTPNYMKKGIEWERPVSFEFMDTGGTVLLTQNAGIRIHGGTSRYAANKSLRLYARAEYGKAYFSHPFFNNGQLSYKRLMLRVSGQDQSATFFRDALMHSILSKTSLDVQAYQPSILFINGEYWGLTNIRERQDEYYVSDKYGIEADSVQIATVDDYLFLDSLAQATDLSIQSNYDKMLDLIDVENYIDLCIADNFFYRWDYLNRKMWKECKQGKWKWFLYDMDVGMGGYGTGNTPWDFNYFEYTLNPHTIENKSLASYNKFSGNVLFKELFKNSDFRDLFFHTYISYLKTIFVPDSVFFSIDSIQKLLMQEMPSHIQRWSIPQSYEIWESEVEKLRVFSLLRPCYIYQQMSKYFGIYDKELEELLTCDCPILPLSEYAIYPNPATNAVTFSFESLSSVPITVQLYNVLGTCVFQGSYISHFGENHLRIDISSFVSGLYVLKTIGGMDVSATFLIE